MSFLIWFLKQQDEVSAIIIPISQRRKGSWAEELTSCWKGRRISQAEKPKLSSRSADSDLALLSCD